MRGKAPAGIGKAMSVTSGTKTESGLGETIRVVIHALLIALVIRTFLFQPFNIPSGSMEATLLVGDYLFVSKYSWLQPLLAAVLAAAVLRPHPGAGTPTRRRRGVPAAEG